MVRVADGVPVFSETEDFAITANLIEQKITDRTKLIIINSPNNPTGSVISKSELEKIADLAVEKNIFVISDECYEFFIYDEKHYSIASLGEKVKELTLTVNALSKTYAMPGWRLGYAGGPEKIIKTMASLQSHLTGNPNSITQKAAVEALLGDQSSIKEMTREFRNRRDLMTKRLNEISGIKCIKPKGAFYCFPDVSQLYNGKIKSSSDFSLYLLDRAHVATVPGIVFGSDKHIRLSFASPMKDIEEGMDRIEKAVRII
jgi:aspartate aminotransferase